ncbi:MAG: hypothetical protein H6974_08345 [Gammaproteobacteria bacterium]|nr:hypothetical protein [Gammaproteobacteria bacterium]
MPSDRRTFDRLRAQARQAREIGDYLQAARLEHQAAEWAGALGFASSRARALLWEGYSLRQAGDDDLALAALLQAAHNRAIAEPADVFSALTAILHISLARKPFQFCRTLLDQTRDWLFDLRQPWSAGLDFLEGELALRRGEFVDAWDWHSRAWAGWRDGHPCLTPATHLWALCRTAFRRCDPAALAQWAGSLTKLPLVQPLERQLVQRAQLLLWRTQRTAPAPVDPALDLLASTAHEARDSGACREVLQVLALADHWSAVDEILRQRSLTMDCFENRLLLGDLALNRLRIALGLPVADDDYNEPVFGVRKPVIGQPVSPEMVDQVKLGYRAAQQLADGQDARLETNWHGRSVHRRQRQLESLVVNP